MWSPSTVIHKEPAMRAEDILPDDINHRTQNGVTIRRPESRRCPMHAAARDRA